MKKKDNKPGAEDVSFLHVDALVVVQRSVDLASERRSGNTPMRKTRYKSRPD
jgi:hypothetical protein